MHLQVKITYSIVFFLLNTAAVAEKRLPVDLPVQWDSPVFLISLLLFYGMEGRFRHSSFLLVRTIKGSVRGVPNVVSRFEDK